MMSVSSTDKGLLTPSNAVLMFIDHQTPMLSGLTASERTALLDNVVVLAKAATLFASKPQQQQVPQQ